MLAYADIVARMPRHANSAGALLDYEHVGKTVLVDEEAGAIAGGFWVEGESQADLCPLREVSPVTNPFSKGTVLGDITQRAAGAFGQLGTTGSSLLQQPNSEQLARALATALKEVSRASDDISKRVGTASALDAVSLTAHPRILHMHTYASGIRMHITYADVC